MEPCPDRIPPVHAVEIPERRVQDFSKNLAKLCQPAQPADRTTPFWERGEDVEDDPCACPKGWMPHLGRTTWLHEGSVFEVNLSQEGSPVATVSGIKYFQRLIVSGQGREAVQAFVTAMLKVEKVCDPLELGRVRLWSATHHGVWMPKGFVPAQTLEDLFLPPKAVSDLLRRIDDFIASAERTARMGRMHKLILLFMGVPGSGKSSLVRALARKYQRELFLLTLGRRMEDEVCEELLMEMKSNSVMLIEDFDSMGFSRSSKKKICKDEDAHGVTRSFFLNMLDGVLRPPSGTIVGLTSNSCTGLDKALARPGRIDVVVRFGDPQDPELLAALERLTTPAGDAQKMRWAFCANVRKLAKGSVCMAGLVDHLQRHPVDFLETFDEFEQRCVNSVELSEEGPQNMYM